MGYSEYKRGECQVLSGGAGVPGGGAVSTLGTAQGRGEREAGVSPTPEL